MSAPSAPSSRRERRKDPASAARRSELRLRLCAVHAFDPAAVPGFSKDEVESLLAHDCDRLVVPGGTRALGLRTDVRVEALRQHPDRASVLRAARSIPARVTTPTQVALEHWLEHGDVGVAATPDDALERVAFWLDALPWAREDARRMRALAREASTRRGLEAMGGDHFVGRSAELGILRDFAERGPGPEPELLLLDATGGMGKTALLARFRLDFGATGKNDVILHVDFDDPDVDVRSPSSVLGRVLTGLAARGTDFAALAEDLGAAGGEDVGEAAYVQAVVFEGVDSRLAFAVERARDLLLAAVAEGRIRRVVVILDTFERPLRQSPESAARTLGLLWHLVNAIAGVLVVAGRGVGDRAFEGVWPTPARPLPLRELERADAEELLRRQGIGDEAVAERILGLVPWRPLTLRLAARAAGARGLELDGDAGLRDAVARQLVDGYLHLRILDHLEDPRVAALVHPGFVLRRITKKLVQELLHDLPSPPVADDADAAQLFEALRQVNDLVTESTGRSGLVLRPEVRAELLALMKRDDERRVTALHRRALAYFLGSGDAAEATYHGLMLGRLDMADRLRPADALDLEGADELPAQAKEALRARTRAHAPGAPMRVGGAGGGGGAAGVRRTLAFPMPAPGPGPARPSLAPLAERLELLLRDGKLDEASALVTHEGPFEDPVLLWLEARLRRMQGAPDEAERAALEARDRLGALGSGLEGAPGAELELELVLAWVESTRGSVEALAAALDRVDAATAALDPEADVLRLQALAAAALLAGPLEERRARYRHAVARTFRALNDSQLRSDRILLLAAGSALEEARDLERALELGALDDVRSAPFAELLAPLLTPLDAARRDAPELVRGVMRALLQGPPALAPALARAVKSRGAPAALCEGVRRLLEEQHRAATRFVAGAAQERAAALSSLEAWIEGAIALEARHELATLVADLGPTRERLQRRDPSARAVVLAADASNQLFALVHRLLCIAPPPALRALLAVRRRLARHDGHEWVTHETLLDTWQALVSGRADTDELLRAWDLAWALDPAHFERWPLEPHQKLAEALELMNYRPDAAPPPGVFTQLPEAIEAT
ncbi:MAG: AAA family ATPase [Myxococcales bacterium]|nr:AAA family ATPase [Myxococcales bacterium]